MPLCFSYPYGCLKFNSGVQGVPSPSRGAALPVACSALQARPCRQTSAENRIGQLLIVCMNASTVASGCCCCFQFAPSTRAKLACLPLVQEEHDPSCRETSQQRAAASGFLGNVRCPRVPGLLGFGVGPPLALCDPRVDGHPSSPRRAESPGGGEWRNRVGGKAFRRQAWGGRHSVLPPAAPLDSRRASLRTDLRFPPSAAQTPSFVPR
mmetsp:Transcript_6690/g.16320  ORF Transcript_6690/g.16320 Transcript_6690/m.16320 type:complete len:209 (-) Transcript_6690:108-734(-)